MRNWSTWIGRHVGEKQRSRTEDSRAAADLARDAGDWSRAADLYKAHLRKHPNDAAGCIQLGHALKESGLLSEAAMAYANVLNLTPGDDDLYLQIGHLEKVRGNLQAAREYYRKAYALNPANHHARDELWTMADTRGSGSTMNADDAPETQAHHVQEHLPVTTGGAKNDYPFFVAPLSRSRVNRHFEKQLNAEFERALDLIGGYQTR